MFINMKFEIVADKARESEQKRDWLKALELWQLAAPLAKKMQTMTGQKSVLRFVRFVTEETF